MADFFYDFLAKNGTRMTRILVNFVFVIVFFVISTKEKSNTERNQLDIFSSVISLSQKCKKPS